MNKGKTKAELVQALREAMGLSPKEYDPYADEKREQIELAICRRLSSLYHVGIHTRYELRNDYRRCIKSIMDKHDVAVLFW